MAFSAGVGGAALVLFTYALAIHPARPGALNPPGWFGFHDQGYYLRLAEDLAGGRLPTPASEYIYGLGYPALAAPFLALRPAGDPFAPVDAAAFVATMVMVAVVGRRLRSAAFGMACAAAVALATPLLDTMVVPWNTTVTVVAALACVVAATSPRPLGPGAGLVLGLATGMAFAARYLDGAFVGLLAVVALAHGRRRHAGAGVLARAAPAACVALLAVVVPVLASHDAVLGSPWRTPYSQQEGRQGQGSNQQELSNFQPAKVPRNFTETFLTGKSEGKRQTADPLLRTFPWALAAPFGALALVRARHRLAAPLVAAFAVSLLATAVYLSYPGSAGAHLVFGSIHYWKAWFPLWGILAAHAAVSALESGGGLSGWRRGRSPEERTARR